VASRVRAVFLDAGGTLFRERSSRAAIYAAAARAHGLDATEAQLAAAMRASHDELPATIGGGFRYSRPWFERFIADVFGRLGHRSLPPGLAPELFERFADARTFRVFDDVVPALDELSRAGMVVGVVSNWSEGLARLLDRLGLQGRFAFVLASAAERREKPGPALFRSALERAGVAAPESMHVGDDLDKDYKSAIDAGLGAVLLDRAQRHEGFRGERIGSLVELPPLLRSRRSPG